jgi:hypothetical protein
VGRDRLLELFKKVAIKIATVKGKTLKVLLVGQGLDEMNTTISALTNQVIVGEEEVGEHGVALKTLTQQVQSVITHLIVAHEDLLNPVVREEGLLDWSNLLIRQSVLEQIQISERQQVE